jgi:L-threonylcarbamoyladenylate synthase
MALQNSLDTLDRSGVVLFPSDTVLGLGCDATNQDAVNKIFLIKNRPQNKSLIALVADTEMLTTYVGSIPQSVNEILKGNSSPTTIVYPKVKGIAPMATAEDGSMAFRIPKSGFALDLVKSFGKPIIATSANLSGEPIPENESQVNHRILEQVDYVVPLKSDTYPVKPSRIIQLTIDGKTKMIRA